MTATEPEWDALARREILANGVRLHLVEAGAGPPVLLLHGFPEFSYGWRRQLPALAAAGFRAVAPDLRGYNLSDKPPRVADYRPETLIADVAGLIRHLGGRVALVGHDWGGILAWGVAARHPELVERLVILNAPHPAAMLRELRTVRQLMKSWYVFFFQLPRLPEWLVRRRDFAFLDKIFRRDPTRPGVFGDEDIRRYKEALSRPGALTAALNYYRAAFRRGPRRPGCDVRRVDVPTLLLWGEQDRYLGVRLSQGLEEWVPDLRVVYFPDASHWIHVEAAAEVNRWLVEFLEPLAARVG